MANRGSRSDPHITIIERDLTTTRYLLRPGSKIGRGPTTGQGQVTTVGESDKRGDTRTPEVIWSDQTGGMGEFYYKEMNGNTSFTDSELDTRYPGMLVLPPPATLLGTMSYTPTGPASPVHVERINASADAVLLVWQWNNNSAGANGNRLDTTPSNAFTSIGFQNITGYTKFGANYVFTLSSANSIRYSNDGVTWNTTAIGAGYYGCCVHDLKFWAWDSANSRLTWTTDVTNAAGWSTSAAFAPGDTVMQLIEWQRGGRAAVFLVCRNRILWYDEDSDSFHEFDSFAHINESVEFPWAAVDPGSGNLNVTLYDTSQASGTDTVLWYSGTRNQTGPNERGGLPAASQVSLMHMAGGMRWMFAFGAPLLGSSNSGRVLAMNQQQTFHRINTGTSSSAYVYGGGYGSGKVYTVLSDGKVYEQDVPDTSALPLYSTRSYKTGATLYHEYAFTDLGSENLPGLALWATVAARDMTATYKKQGLPANTSGVIEYMRDTDTAWTSLGAFGSSDSYPLEFAFRSGFGLPFNQIKLRVGITSSSSSASPVITSVALAALREEAIRDAYQCQIDLSWRDHILYRGKSPAQLLATLERIRQPGILVKVLYGEGDESMPTSSLNAVPSCKVEWSGEEDPHEGPGTYTLRFTDYGKPDYVDLITAQPAG